MIIQISFREIETLKPEHQKDVYIYAKKIKKTYVAIDSEIYKELAIKYQPDLLTKFKNLAIFVKQAGLKSLMNDQEELLRLRLPLCESCSFYDSQHISCLHHNCGCFLNRKTLLSVSKCPIGRW